MAALLAATVLLFFPLFRSLSLQHTDFGAHLKFVGELLRTGSTSLSHFTFEYAVIFFNLMGLTLAESATTAAVVAVALTGLVIFWILRDETGPWLAAALGLVLLLVGPMSIVTLAEKELYLGFITPNTYHNPTLVLLKPAALLLLVLSIRAFEEGVESPRWGLIAVTALLSVFSCLTKPSFQICFLPGLGLLAAIAILRKREVDLWLCVLGIALPSLLTLIYQYLGNFTAGSTQEILFAPLEVISAHSSRLVLKFVLSLIFPAAVLIAFFKEARRDLLFQTTWATAIVGFAYAYLLAESGTRFGHGNFLWSGQVAMFTLYVAAVPLLLRQKQNSKALFCWGIFGLHGISGAIFAFTQSLGARYLEWW